MSLVKFFEPQIYLLIILLIQCHIILTYSSFIEGDTEDDESKRGKFSNILWDSEEINNDFKKFLEFPDNRDVIVHLHDWKYREIEKECSNLNQYGYAAVQISPVTTHARYSSHPWDERLSVVNYDFNNDSGDEKDLEMMIKACNKSNIKVFADVVINNMARSTDTNDKDEYFAGMEYKSKDGRILYTKSDFHETCVIENGDYYKEVVDFNENGKIVFPKETAKASKKESIKSQLTSNIQTLEEILQFYKAKRNKKGFSITSFLIERNKKEILWTCMSDNRHDLKQLDDENRPKKQILELFTRLIHLGVSGFRILLADHMDPDHLHTIYDWLPPQAPLFIYHDVYDPMRHERADHLVRSEEYAVKTRASDYRYANLLSKTFLSRKVKVREMYNLQQELDLLPSEDSVVFVNNFITLRLGRHGIGQPILEDTFIYRECSEGKKALLLATSFMLTHSHGIPLVTSSYCWDERKKVYDNEHSWDAIKHMIKFRNVLKKYNKGVIPPPDKFRQYGLSQSTHCLGVIGFVAYNDENPEQPLMKFVDTCFENEGIYCDVIGGGLNTGEDANNKPCIGNSMKVTHDGKKGELKMNEKDGLAAFHIDAMVPLKD